ncbi:MAG: hypothetical protein IAG10_34750 [Planctomycetaceae bacterium]|nr:hypothetical protein [Planctomycetaceae bacterium]
MNPQAPHDTLQSDTSETGQDIVLLIHGTFAGSNDDKGDKWWQRESKFWNDLNNKLGGSGAVCFEVFQWSGTNSEIARQQAATGLLLKLIHPNARGKRFHLIGHSHGGSVIWLALKMAEANSHFFGLMPNGETWRLDNVKTWSTIGTPFISYRFLSTVETILWSLVFVVLGSPIFALSWWYGLGASDEFPTKLWWTAVPLGLATLMLMEIGIIAPIQKGVDQGRDRRTLDRFGSRWLGIWSLQDEAIQGLKESVTLHRKTTTESKRLRKFHGLNEMMLGMGMQPSVLVIHLIRKLLSVPIRVLSVLFNPLATWWFWSKLRKMIQGNDLLFRECDRVEASPVPNAGEPLQGDLDLHLIDLANRHATALVPKFRQSLGQTELPPVDSNQLIGAILGDFTGAGLVHNSYYDHPDVRELLVTHIRQSLSNQGPPIGPPLREELRLWYESFRRSVSTMPAQPTMGKLDC